MDDHTLGKYSEEKVREFYASNVSNIKGSISKRDKSTCQPPLEPTPIWCFSIDISETTLSRLIYILDHTLPFNTTSRLSHGNTLESSILE